MSDKAKHLATLAAALMSESAGRMFDDEIKSGAALMGAMASAYSVTEDALALIRIGRGVSRWAVKACNGEGHWHYDETTRRGGWRWNETDDKAKEKADDRARAKLQAIADRYGAKVKLGGDPRGYVVKLILASGRHNTWGGASDGWGVA